MIANVRRRATSSASAQSESARQPCRNGAVTGSRAKTKTSWRWIGSHALAGLAAALAALPAAALDKVTFGTNWKAQAEHGGYYQAVVDGTYEKYGLDVTIRQGGPNINHPQLLAAGKIDFNMGGNMFAAFNYLTNDVPMVTVAAAFQKDPQILMVHPDSPYKSLADLKGVTLLIGKGGQITFWQWLKKAYGFSDEQIRPYTFNPAPFIANKDWGQQGYVTSEPFAVERVGGFVPRVFLLADNGYASYSTTVETSWKLVDENPDLVQRFVDATALGWVNYLYGDHRAADELIKRDNPDISDDQLAYSIAKMKQYGIVDSGDTETLGINAMTDARWQSFYRFAVDAGLYRDGLPLAERGYTLRFVNKGVGLDRKRELLGKQ
ncbi:ABC transporter substrate-binding protein [Thalassobaculum sp.]|uniref:ABC transporter substrate-binding protein n=1 Tax=Thalassobaculum sp. TaxID=2022740 RepID=UPI0032F08D43